MRLVAPVRRGTWRALDDAVDGVARAAQSDADEVEIGGGDRGDGGAVGLVVAGAEQLAGVDGQGDIVAGGGLAARLGQQGGVGAHHHHRLAQHGQVLGVLAHLGSPAPTLRDAPLARRLRALLDDRLTESFTIAAAAAELGTHPSHLVRVFSQTYGIAPHRYLVGRRVDLARRLLVDGHRPVAAAALAGFHDQSHLTRHFRRILGVTPATFAA